MAHTPTTAPRKTAGIGDWPIIALLNPREHTTWVLVAVLTGIVAGSLGMQWLDWPFWSAVAAVIVFMLVPSIAKWRSDQQKYGEAA